MTIDQGLILAALVVLLVWGRWRYDAVAVAALLAGVLAGVVPAGDAFLGFGHPATITVALVLVLSNLLGQSGATDVLAQQLDRLADRPRLQLVGLLGSGALLSGFMNNVASLALLMPVAVTAAQRAGRPLGGLLMPLSFATILGGLVTLIGTPPNIIIAGLRERTTGESFAMFDFAPVGGVAALAGLLLLALVGARLLPKRAREGGKPEELFEVANYVTELRVPRGSAAIGKKVSELRKDAEEVEFQLLGIVRRKRRIFPPPRGEVIRSGDHLLLQVEPGDIEKLAELLELRVGNREAGIGDLLAAEEEGTLEALVPADSRLQGRTVAQSGLDRRFGVRVIGIARRGRPQPGHLHSLRLAVGDVLLLHGEAESLPDAVRALGLLPIYISFALAITVIVFAGLAPLRSVYESINWPVIVLLGALIPVGGALQQTGTTDLVAAQILRLAGDWPPMAVIALLLVVTITLSDAINNAATAIVMGPIALSVAERLQANPDGFLMAVAVGASCAFLTPIGHQNNALIMGPGGYRFGDYWRLGLPVELLIVAIALPAIFLVWPP